MEEGILIGFKRFYEMLLKGMEPSHPMQDFADYHQKSQMILADMLYVSNWAVDSWIHFFMEMHSVTNGSDNLASKYTISLKMNGSDLQINAICLDPARSFNFLREHEPYSIILTSGTLTPIKFWEAELQVKFPKPLCCPHIIQSEQLFAATVTHGPKNHPLNFSFKERDKTVVYKALGEVLLEIVRSVPSGIIVLFSSYGLMDTCCHELRNYSLMGQFYKHKEMFIEDRNSVNFKDQLENFTKASRTGKGALMFAVMRGKVAEGIDLCDDECRAIVLVGVPFPNLKDKKIEAKKNYLDAQKSALNGRDWYMAETYRSINQALGRVIRGINDYGAVYLLDQRFEKQEIRQHISDWVSSRLETYYDIGRLGLETRKFF
ncbi:MAG: hypothetical protein JST59_02925 [Actinobacteria bacterium]|nr:hypothetical protein [Actinomycetota bacterium]